MLRADIQEMWCVIAIEAQVNRGVPVCQPLCILAIDAMASVVRYEFMPLAGAGQDREAG